MHKAIATTLAAAALVLGGGALYADETLPSELDESAAYEVEYTVCAQGVLKECGSITSRRCTEWMITNANGTVSLSPYSGSASAGATVTCASWTTTTTKLYKDRYKPKST